MVDYYEEWKKQVDKLKKLKKDELIKIIIKLESALENEKMMNSFKK